MTDDIQLKINKLDDRMRNAENAIATLSSNITINIDNIKENLASSNLALGHRIEGIRGDVKENHHNMTDAINALRQSLQNLYVSYSGAQAIVKINEKVIWGVIGLIVTVGLYILQDIIKAFGAG